MTAWTVERPAPGVHLHQPARGFRYGAEAFWLVGLALSEGPVTRARDLGTGSGIMAWLLAGHGVEVEAVDVRAEWQEAWRATARDSVVAGRVRTTLRDVADLPDDEVDLVVCNPPFFVQGTGPEPSDPWTRAARFEGPSTLATFVDAAARSLGPAGRAWFVVPTSRAPHLLRVVPSGFSADRRVMIGARRVAIRCVPGADLPVSTRQVADRGPEVDAWYALATRQGSGRPVRGDPCP